MDISPRYNTERYSMRGTANRKGDRVHSFSRKINGRVFDFSRVRWADGRVTVTASNGGTTEDLHTWETPTAPALPGHLNLAIRWERGWKTYEVTGTRHAYYMLRKMAGYDGFGGARLDVSAPDFPNVISLDEFDILGSDPHGKFAALLDRNNIYYDLSK